MRNMEVSFVGKFSITRRYTPVSVSQLLIMASNSERVQYMYMIAVKGVSLMDRCQNRFEKSSILRSKTC